MADAAAGRGFKKAALAASSLATGATAKGSICNESTGGAHIKEATKPAAATGRQAQLMTGTAVTRPQGQQPMMRSAAASLEPTATTAQATPAGETPAAAAAASRTATSKIAAQPAVVPAAGKGSRRQDSSVEAQLHRFREADHVASASKEDLAAPSGKTGKRVVLARGRKAGYPDTASKFKANTAMKAATSRRRTSSHDTTIGAVVKTAAVVQTAACKKGDGERCTAAVKKNHLVLDSAADDQTPLHPARQAYKAESPATAIRKKEEQPSLTCSSCNENAQNVLLLSCHHCLCLICAAKAAETLQHVRVAPSSPKRKIFSSPSRCTRIDLLQCPVCKETTALSAATSTALRQHLRFFENPTGCCFDAGPVGCTTATGTAAGAATREEEKKKKIPYDSENKGGRIQEMSFIPLCSQCEQHQAAVYCCNCVRRYCAACAVETHDRHPQMLKHRFQLLHQQEEFQQQHQQEEQPQHQQLRGAETRKDTVALDIPPAQLALRNSAQHMRTINDCCASFLSSSRASSVITATAAGKRLFSIQRKGKKENWRRTAQHRKSMNEERSSIHRRSTIPRNSSPCSSNRSSDPDSEEDDDSVHSSAIGFHIRTGTVDEIAWAQQDGGGGAALLYRLRNHLAALSLFDEEEETHKEAKSAGRGLSFFSHKKERFPQYVPVELLHLRSVTNVACYVHGSQPVEFFCCTCECYCICAYCLTGFYPSGGGSSNSSCNGHRKSAATAAAAVVVVNGGAPAADAAAGATSTEDHVGHFLQAVDLAWSETVLPRIEDEWGNKVRTRRRRKRRGSRRGTREKRGEEEDNDDDDDGDDDGSGPRDLPARREADSFSSVSPTSFHSPSPSRQKRAGDDRDDLSSEEEEDEEGFSVSLEGRGILGQALGEVELLQQQFLLEKSKEWRHSLQNDISVVETTSELLLQKLEHKQQQLRGALEAFTIRFCSETEEARRRLLQQSEGLRDVLRELRVHKAALDPAVLLNYYRDERTRIEDLCAVDSPQEYRQLPLSRRSVLQHAGQVVEELCGLAAELGGHVKEADGTLFERLQQQQLDRKKREEEGEGGGKEAISLTLSTDSDQKDSEGRSLSSSRRRDQKQQADQSSTTMHKAVTKTRSRKLGLQDVSQSAGKAKEEDKEEHEKDEESGSAGKRDGKGKRGLIVMKSQGGKSTTKTHI